MRGVVYRKTDTNAWLNGLVGDELIENEGDKKSDAMPGTGWILRPRRLLPPPSPPPKTLKLDLPGLSVNRVARIVDRHSQWSDVAIDSLSRDLHVSRRPPLPPISS